jgi:hypothetical protein
MLGQQRKIEPSGNAPISSGASKNPTCPVVVESMLEGSRAARPTPGFSAVS